MNKSLLTAALAAVTFLVVAASAQAQLLVYGLSLKKIDRSVNYTFFEGGYLVVDTAASSFSSVIVLTDPNTFEYYQAPDLVTGSYTTILDYSGRNYGVMFGANAVGSTSTDNAALQLIGDISENKSVGGGMRSDLAKKLTGSFMASGAQVEASSSNTTATTFEYGFAGTSKATATYDADLTRRINNDKLGSAAAVTLIGQIIAERTGIPGPTPTPTPTPSPTATPTPTVTPTPTPSS